MKTRVRLALAQINTTVGDIAGNCRKISQNISEAIRLGADIVSFPEAAVTGYSPDDILYDRSFVSENILALKKIAASCGDIVAVVGFIDRKGGKLYNAAAVIRNGRVRSVYHKMLLANFGVFDEKRYFEAGSDAAVFRYGDLVFGVNVCRDIWLESGPTPAQAKKGAALIVNINASPFFLGRPEVREDTVRKQASSNRVAVAYTNMAGGQDELVFDGQSMVVDRSGSVVARAAMFSEDLMVVDIHLASASKAIDAIELGAMPSRPKKAISKNKPVRAQAIPSAYGALVYGLREYMSKNGFRKAVLGMSGGIDSSLTAAIAVDAIGRENVTGVYMPTRYSSAESEADAAAVAKNLGIKLLSIPVDPIFKIYLMSLEPKFAGRGRDIAEENLQARIRGNILMALSNKFGWLVLSTGNKSEIATGYGTLYGDMAGGFAVIKDALKTLVYKLAHYRNSIKKVIPAAIFEKDPTAELKFGQKDQDTLPPYKTLDAILKAYIEEEKTSDEIVKMGHGKNTVSKVISMVTRSEYKRRQAPPGTKITAKSFASKDRRMPITNRYEG